MCNITAPLFMDGWVMRFYIKDVPKERDVSKEYTYDEIWKELVLNRKYTKGDRVVVVDLDVMMFRVSSACQTTFINVNRGKTNKRFKSRTEFKKYCKDKGLDYNTFTITDDVEAEPIAYCIHTLKQSIKKLGERLEATKFIFTMGGSYNYRLDLPLPKRYKSNRDNMQKPVHYNNCKEYAIKYLDALVVCGDENDALTQGISEYINNNTEATAIVYTNDKDIMSGMNPNLTYNPTTDEVIELDGSIGMLYERKNDVKGVGLHYLLFQVFLGDPVDLYTPKPFFTRRYADKSYFKDFSGIADEHELLTKWWQKWCELLPETIEYTDWNGEECKLSRLSLAELMFSCAYMRVTPTDVTTFESLLIKYGVDYG